MAGWRDPATASATVNGWVETSLGRESDDQGVLVAVADTGAVVGFVTVTERRH